jgi:hypothetical protein
METLLVALGLIILMEIHPMGIDVWLGLVSEVGCLGDLVLDWVEVLLKGLELNTQSKTHATSVTGLHLLLVCLGLEWLGMNRRQLEVMTQSQAPVRYVGA